MTTIRDFLAKEELTIQAQWMKTEEVASRPPMPMAAGGGASGGTGGGPAPERMISAPGAKLVAKGKKIDELDVEDMKATAPPGCESMVQKLKGKYGEDSSSPFKIAWAAHKKGHCG